jgi:hypothetical protein
MAKGSGEGGWQPGQTPTGGATKPANGMTMPTPGQSDPAMMQRFRDFMTQMRANPGATVNAGTPPANTVAPGAALPPTSNDPIMGPSYMPNQPNMAGAPVAAAPAAAPAPKKPVTPTPAATTPPKPPGGIDPKVQQQAWDILMRGGSMGGGSYGGFAGPSRAFADQQRQRLALGGQGASPETRQMLSAMNQRMVDMFNQKRSGNRQGGSR